MDGSTPQAHAAYMDKPGSFIHAHPIWAIVKIMVPFWIPINIRHLVFRLPKKGDYNFLQPLIGCRTSQLYSLHGAYTRGRLKGETFGNTLAYGIQQGDLHYGYFWIPPLLTLRVNKFG